MIRIFQREARSYIWTLLSLSESDIRKLTRKSRRGSPCRRPKKTVSAYRPFAHEFLVLPYLIEAHAYCDTTLHYSKGKKEIMIIFEPTDEKSRGTFGFYTLPVVTTSFRWTKRSFVTGESF